jgi:GNAT superfamily N-acetyltransferase
MNVKITASNIKDADDLFRAFLNCGKYTRSMYYPHRYTKEDAIQICSNTSKSGVHYIVRIGGDVRINSKTNNDIIGFGFINVKNKSFGFAIIDKYQHKGIGTIFMDYILRYAKEHGFKTIKTEGGTHVESHLKDILIKRGFKITKRFMLRNKPTLVMEKSL